MNKLERAVVRARKKTQAAETALQYARRAVQDYCTHPDNERRETRTSDDDGYGRWFTRVGEQCALCGRTRTYAGQGAWLETSYRL
jgi:hypothetical protein